MTVTVDAFVTRFPQFDGEDEDQIQALLNEAASVVSPDTWKAEDVTPAILYLTAHLMVTEATADSLPVTSESLGPISVSYAAPQSGSDLLLTTEYGRRFAALRRRNFGGPVVI